LIESWEEKAAEFYRGKKGEKNLPTTNQGIISEFHSTSFSRWKETSPILSEEGKGTVLPREAIGKKTAKPFEHSECRFANKDLLTKKKGESARFKAKTALHKTAEKNWLAEGE